MRRAVIAVALSIVCCDVIAAQVRVVRYGDDRLYGITEVDVIVATPPEPHAMCQAAPSSWPRPALTALRSAGIKATHSLKARSSPYSVVIEVRIAAAASGCAATVTTELVAGVSGIPDADSARPPGEWGSLLVGFMPLTHETALVISSAVEHDASVQRVIEAHVASIAARIRSVNQ